MANSEQLSDFGPDNKANQPLRFDFPQRESGKTNIKVSLFQGFLLRGFPL